MFRLNEDVLATSEGKVQQRAGPSSGNLELSKGHTDRSQDFSEYYELLHWHPLPMLSILFVIFNKRISEENDHDRRLNVFITGILQSNPSSWLTWPDRSRKPSYIKVVESYLQTEIVSK